MFAESSTAFLCADLDAKVEFVRDDKGAITGLVLHLAGEDFLLNLNQLLDSVGPC